MARTKKFIDYTNKKIGKLFLVKYVGRSRWECVCDCGFSFEITSQSLRVQNQKRCRFCFYKDKTIHGGSGTPEYQAWKHIKERCYDKTDRMYPNYGGRGISMCDRWLGENGVVNFINDVGKRPSKKYSIDRIDVNKNYEPDNCKWSTRKEQNNNKTNTIYIEYKGVKLNLAQWAEKTGMRYSLLSDRYHRNWDTERIFNQPKRKSIKHDTTK